MLHNTQSVTSQLEQHVSVTFMRPEQHYFLNYKFAVCALILIIFTHRAGTIFSIQFRCKKVDSQLKHNIMTASNRSESIPK